MSIELVRAAVLALARVFAVGARFREFDESDTLAAPNRAIRGMRD